MTAFVAAPHPTVHNNHGDSDLPTAALVAYLAIALIIWAAVALVVARRSAAREHRGKTGPVPAPSAEQLGDAVLVGAAAAVMWPVSVLAGGVWLLVHHATRPADAREPQ